MKITLTIDWRKVSEALLWTLTMVSGAAYTLGDVAQFFPPKWKSTVFVVSLISTTLVKLWRAVPPLPGSAPAASVSVPPGIGQNWSTDSIAPDAAVASSFTASSGREELGTIAGVRITRVGEKLCFTAGLAIDADGSPHAYHPNSNFGLDALENAGGPGHWYGIATDQNGVPIVQGMADPAPGFYVSTTALEDPRFEHGDPRRYVDSEKIPYIVLPAPVMKRWGIKLGAECFVTNTENGEDCRAIVADIGPRNKIGEGSIALAKAIGLKSDPRRGGTDRHIIEYEVALA